MPRWRRNRVERRVARRQKHHMPAPLADMRGEGMIPMRTTKGRKAPAHSATGFPIGTRMSGLDEREWKVGSSKRKGKTIHRWIRA